MRRALVAGLCAPLLIAAQSDAHVDHIDSDKGAAWVGLAILFIDSLFSDVEL